MTEYSILLKAPITEAIIDIRVETKETDDIQKLKLLHKQVIHEYPGIKTRQKWEGKFNFKSDGPPVAEKTTSLIDGYLFTSTDGKQIFQARQDGFAFNRLAPYQNWDSFRTEAFRLWRLYKEETSPKIIRVAVRYINKFDIPLPIKDFNEYLVAAPIVPEELPQGVSNFLSRIELPFPELDAMAIIIQAMDKVVKPHLLPIILDIDVFKVYTEGVEEGEAWRLLEKFREFKNKIFFSSITEKAKELFK